MHRSITRAETQADCAIDTPEMEAHQFGIMAATSAVLVDQLRHHLAEDGRILTLKTMLISPARFAWRARETLLEQAIKVRRVRKPDRIGNVDDADRAAA